MRTTSVPDRTLRMLRIICLAFLIILLRVWHLEIIQKNQKKLEADRPRRRTIAIQANRGTLFDRFHTPLATNKICYNATLYYNQIAQIAARGWKEDEMGKQARYFPRKEYISKLSSMLASTLNLDPNRVEDLIHSKASLFPHAPFLLKASLSEKEYYHLAALEKDWPGLHAEIASERFYPEGKCGAEIIGYMGSISSKEYLKIADEIRSVQAQIDAAEDPELWPNSVEALSLRLQELKEKSYRIQDLIGKSGIEGYFEESLRGFYGKKIYSVDQKGKILGELPGGKEAIPGEQIDLTLSIELQKLAEELLAENEAVRERRAFSLDPYAKPPWIQGGSLIAMDPNTGEILAMASTPRFDPNDFIPTHNPVETQRRQKNLCRWLENEKQIGDIWDGKQDLTRERYSSVKGFFEESQPLTWDRFLEMILPPNSPLKVFFQRIDDVKGACQVQEDFETVLYASKASTPSALFDQLYTQNLSLGKWEAEALSALKRLDTLLTPLSTNRDRLFAIDLCRLVVYAPAFTDETLKLLGSMKLAQYRALNQMACRLETELKETAKKSFRQIEFKAWRKEHQKDFLAEKRSLEKKEKLPSKPYLDYLDQKEKELFAIYWKEKRLSALREALPRTSLAYAALETFRSFDDLERPLLTTYRKLRSHSHGQMEKHLAATFYPIGGFGYTRAYSFQANAPQGSIFKLVSGYAGLLQMGGENTFSLIDEVRMQAKSFSVASTLGGVPYLRMYKGGRLPKSSRPHIGKIDLIGAIEQTSNPYFSILAGDILKNPEELNEAARLFGFGAKTGIDLLGEGSGNLPTDLSYNRTGLYSTAIGQHTLLSTPLQTAVMLCSLANGGKVLKPEVLKHSEPHVLRTIPFPSKSREQLLEGMKRVVWSNKGTARPEIIRALRANPALLPSFLALRGQMIGKTGTAEVLFNPNSNPSSVGQMIKHIWFGAIAFEAEDAWTKPELVVVVCLRHGDAGKEAAPLAAQIVTKWREIKKKRNGNP